MEAKILTCPNCGANLQPRSSGKCPYCGTCYESDTEQENRVEIRMDNELPDSDKLVKKIADAIYRRDLWTVQRPMLGTFTPNELRSLAE